MSCVTRPAPCSEEETNRHKISAQFLEEISKYGGARPFILFYTIHMSQYAGIEAILLVDGIEAILLAGIEAVLLALSRRLHTRPFVRCISGTHHQFLNRINKPPCNSSAKQFTGEAIHRRIAIHRRSNSPVNCNSSAKQFLGELQFLGEAVPPYV